MDEAPAVPPSPTAKPADALPQLALFEPQAAPVVAETVVPEAGPEPAAPTEPAPQKAAIVVKPQALFPLGASIPHLSGTQEWSAGTDANVIGGIGSWQYKLPPRHNEPPTAQALPDIWNRQSVQPQAAPVSEAVAPVESEAPAPAPPPMPPAAPLPQPRWDEPVEMETPLAAAPADWIAEQAYPEQEDAEQAYAETAYNEDAHVEQGFEEAEPLALAAATPIASRPRWVLPAFMATLAFWRMSTAASLVLAAALGFALFGHHDIPLPRAVAAIGVANAPAPLFLAEADPAGHIRITPLAVIAVPNGRDLHLWMIPPGAQSPLSLGLLGQDGAMASLGGAPVEGTRLIVTLEPHGGLGSQITGQVLYGGTLAIR